MEQKELRRHIRTLERRQNYLGQRIAERRGKTIDNDQAFDRAEFKALQTAITCMESLFHDLSLERGEVQIRGTKE